MFPLLLVLTASLVCAESTIHLGIGETHKLPTTPSQTLRLQKKGILQIKDEGRKILFIGKKLGQTQVTLGSKSYQFIVLHKHHRDTLEQLQRWAKDKRGPQVGVVNHQVVIQGRILRLQDFIALKNFTHAKSQFQITAQVAPSISQAVGEHLRQLLLANNLPPPAN
jgi:hypothetical protein